MDGLHENPKSIITAKPILELYEAIEVIDPHDRQKILQQQTSAATALENIADFRQEYVNRRRLLRESQADGADVPPPAPPSIPIPHHCDQPQAKALIPPGSSIWRNLYSNGWMGHYKPNRRVSATFRKHGGSQDALKVVLRKLWQQHCEKTGDPVSVCPIIGLF